MGHFTRLNAWTLRLVGYVGALIALGTLVEVSILGGLFLGAGSALVIYAGILHEHSSNGLLRFGTLALAGVLVLIGLGVGFGG